MIGYDWLITPLIIGGNSHDFSSIRFSGNRASHAVSRDVMPDWMVHIGFGPRGLITWSNIDHAEKQFSIRTEYSSPITMCEARYIVFNIFHQLFSITVLTRSRTPPRYRHPHPSPSHHHPAPPTSAVFTTSYPTARHETLLDGVRWGFGGGKDFPSPHLRPNCKLFFLFLLFLKVPPIPNKCPDWYVHVHRYICIINLSALTVINCIILFS